MGQSQNRDTIRYATSGGVSSSSIDAKKSDPLLYDDPMEDFEVEDPKYPLPIPPKPKVKKAPKEPSITASVNPCYANSGYEGVPAKQLQPHTQIQGQIQGQVQQSKGWPPSPVYESLDWGLTI